MFWGVCYLLKINYLCKHFEFGMKNLIVLSISQEQTIINANSK